MKYCRAFIENDVFCTVYVTQFQAEWNYARCICYGLIDNFGAQQLRKNYRIIRKKSLDCIIFCSEQQCVSDVIISDWRRETGLNCILFTEETMQRVRVKYGSTISCSALSVLIIF